VKQCRLLKHGSVTSAPSARRHVPRPGSLEAAGGRVAAQALPAADRHLRLRCKSSGPQSLGCAHRPLRGFLGISRNHVVYGDFFPLYPLIPQLTVVRVLGRGMWGMRGMFLGHARKTLPLTHKSPNGCTRAIGVRSGAIATEITTSVLCPPIHDRASSTHGMNKTGTIGSCARCTASRRKPYGGLAAQC
jgi:hypothetical protein